MSFIHKYVDVTGGNNSNSGNTVGAAYQTIGTAIGQLTAGDGGIIEMVAGTYPEGFKPLGGGFAQSLPSGADWNSPVIFKPYNSGTVIIQPPNTTYSGAFNLQDNTQYIWFQDLIVDGTNLDPDQAACYKFAYGSDPATCARNIRVSGGQIRNSPGQGILTAGSVGSIEIYNCRIHHIAVGGVAGRHGMYLTSTDCWVHDCELDHNTASGGASFQWSDAINFVMERCIIHDNTFGQIIYNHSTGVVKNCVSYGNGYDFYLGVQGDAVKILNCTTYNTSGGHFTSPVLCDTLIIRNHVAYGGGSVFGGMSGGTGSITLDHNLTDGTDPVFVNAGAGNFALQVSSPCIDAGVTDTAASTDYLSVPRPKGSAYDIGAYEYNPGGGASADNRPFFCKR